MDVAAAALSQRHQGVRGRGAQRQLCRRRRRAATSRRRRSAGWCIFWKTGSASRCSSARPTSLVTTAAGRAYQSGLTPIFDALASLTAQVTAPSSVRVLTIGVGPTFAMKWLIPRLADFRKEEPDIDVRITTGGAAAPFGDDWSCGIQLGDGEWPGLTAEPLFAADLLPVCAPRLAQRAETPRRPEGTEPAARRAFAGRLAVVAEGRAACRASRARGPEFQFYGQALQAAVDGLGIAMGIRPYIDDDLAAGRLVAPFALSVPKGMRWYLVYRGFRTEQRDFAAFRRWIIRAAAGACRRAAEAQRAVPVERIETLVIGGGQAGLTMSHRLKQRGAAASGAGAASDRRALAQRTLGRPAIPVSELVGAAAGFSVSAQPIPTRFASIGRDRRLHRGLCRFRRSRRSAAASR